MCINIFIMSSSLFDPYQVTRNPKRIQYSGQVLRRKRVNKKPGCFSNNDLETAFKVLDSYQYVYYPFRPFTYPFTTLLSFPMDHASSNTFTCLLDLERATRSLIARYDPYYLPYDDERYQLYFQVRVLAYSYYTNYMSSDLNDSTTVTLQLSGKITNDQELTFTLLPSAVYSDYVSASVQFNISANADNQFFASISQPSNQRFQNYITSSNSTEGQEIYKYIPTPEVNTRIFEYLARGTHIETTDPSNITIFQTDIYDQNGLSGVHRFNVTYVFEIGVVTLPGAPLFSLPQ